jgi:hypothetical protein
MERLSNYDRGTVGLWRRAHAEMAPPQGQGCLAGAAVHAVLAGLRRHRDGAALLAAYDSSPNADADFALIASLLPDGPANPLYYQVREAAFYLRWRELGGAP